MGDDNIAIYSWKSAFRNLPAIESANQMKVTKLSVTISAALCLICGVAQGRSEEPSLRTILIGAIQANKNLDEALRASYDAVQRHISGVKIGMLKADIEAAGGKELYSEEYAGFMRLMVAKRVVANEKGIPQDLAIDVRFVPKTGELVEIGPSLVAVPKVPTKRSKGDQLYPNGSVGQRAMALPALRSKAVRNLLIDEVDITYKRIGWPSNPITGSGYYVTVELKTRPNSDGRVSYSSQEVVAFAVVDKTSGVNASVSTEGSHGTRLWSVPDLEMAAEPGVKPAFFVLNH